MIRIISESRRWNERVSTRPVEWDGKESKMATWWENEMNVGKKEETDQSDLTVNRVPHWTEKEKIHRHFAELS